MSKLQSSLRECQIFLVEGNSHHRELLAGALHTLGARRLTLCASALQAETTAKKVRPELLMLDWSIQPVDGVAYASEIRHGRSVVPFDTPILLIGDRNDPRELRTAQFAGVDEYLLRPFSSNGLGESLAAILFRRRPFVDCAVYVGPCRRRDSSLTSTKRRRREDVPARAAAQTRILHEFRERLAQAQAAFADPAFSAGARFGAAEDAALFIEHGLRNVDDMLAHTAAAALVRHLAASKNRSLRDPEVMRAYFDALSRLLSTPLHDDGARLELARAMDRLIAFRERKSSSEAA